MNPVGYLTDKELEDWKYILNYWVECSPITKAYLSEKALQKGRPITKMDILELEDLADFYLPPGYQELFDKDKLAKSKQS